MKRPGHMRTGFYFCGLCFLIACSIYLLVRQNRPSPPSSTVAAATPANPQAVPTQATGPALPALASIGAHEGEDYGEIRKRMLAAGFTPAQFLHRDCSPYDETPGAECHDRPEVLQCSGSGKGYCDAYWTDGSRVLSVTPGEGPDGYLAGATVIEAKGFAEGLEEEGNELTGSAVAAFRRAGAVVRSKPKLTAAWLVGTWGRAQYNPDNNPNSACDTDGVVTFVKDGSYRNAGSYGRYSTDGKTITYSDRVMYDPLSDEPEDRSEFNTPSQTQVQVVDRNTMREAETLWRRCQN